MPFTSTAPPRRLAVIARAAVLMAPAPPRRLAVIAHAAVLLAALAAAPPAAADGLLATAWARADLFGGDVRSLALPPGDPDVVYAGTTHGQVYRSADGGATWADAGQPVPFPGWVVSDLVFDAERPERLWATLWGLWGGGLVAYSDDGAATWTYRAGALSETKVYTLATVPGRRDRLYAGTLNGVYRSDDAGETWHRMSAHLPEIYKVTSLLVGPEPETVIAGTWQRAYRSDDGGRTWRGLYDGMVPDSEVFTLKPVPGRPGELWASTCGWVYGSKNGGDRWQRYRDGFENRRVPAFEALPGGRLLAGTVDGLHVSDDGGRSWRRSAPAGLSILEIAYHPQRPRRVYLATEGSGVWVSDDGGDSLAWSANGMTNLRVAALLASGGRILAAVNNAGLTSGIYSSRDGGLTFSPQPAPLPTVLDLAAHRGALYAATEQGLWENRGDSWRMIGEIGKARVEQVLSSPERLVVRTPSGFWELAGPRFQALDYRHAPPKSAVLLGDDLWVGDGRALYRLAAGSNHTLESPAPAGRLARAGGGLLLWASEGLWLRRAGSGSAEADSWVRFAAGADRVLPTGDDRFAALVVSADGLALADTATGRLHPLPVPLMPREVVSAVLHGRRLLLGTAGKGLWVADLALPGAAGEAPVAAAAR
jgi:photosystem II stability/assembly factor-like uncharacterized protein